MIDTVDLVWDHSLEPTSRTAASRPAAELRAVAGATRRLRRISPAERREHALTRLIAEHERAHAQRLQAKNAPLPARPELDLAALAQRLGTGAGEVRAIAYGEKVKTYATWRIASHVELKCGPRRIELRASLPKLLLGRNDVVLNERGVHEALLKLVAIASEATGIELSLREARPIRLDYAFQWSVPSVAGVLEHLKASFHPTRKLRTEHVTPKGGHSLVYGYRGKHVLRFYDKVGELAERGVDPVVESENVLDFTVGEEQERSLDTLLRYEVQDRRRGRLQLIHERGYTAEAIRDELVAPIEGLERATMLDLNMLLEQRGSRVGSLLSELYLAEHEELWPQLRRHLSSTTYYRWRARSRATARALTEWVPVIPAAAFAPERSLWDWPATRGSGTSNGLPPAGEGRG